MTDHTIDVGYVHVGDPDAINRERTWVCADDCPHPDHEAPDFVPITEIHRVVR